MTIEAIFTDFPVLTTQRLHLRQLRSTDVEAFFALRSDPKVTEAYGKESHRSLDETRADLQRLQGLYEQHQVLCWAITFKGDDVVIGTCLLWNFDAAFQCAEVGYELSRSYWRQGLATEVLAALLDYAFTVLGLHRVEAVVRDGNTPSCNLLLKAGFTQEGRLRQRYFFRNQHVDDLYFGLLKDEWPG